LIVAIDPLPNAPLAAGRQAVEGHSQHIGGGPLLPRSICLWEKVNFLKHWSTHGAREGGAVCRETHMSWVFLADDKVLKLKKPVRFPYLDFSTLEKRRAACLAELSLNRRLAPDIYEDVVPMTWSPAGLAIGGCGEVVDWLVVMSRLDEPGSLEHALRARTLEVHGLEPLIATLRRFYRRTPRIAVPPALLVSRWHRNLDENRHILLRPGCPLPVPLVRFVDRVQTEFLARRGDLLAARARDGQIVDGHGDLRPEHIWLGPPVRIIDCLEFNRQLRALDPLDELAYLCLECDRLGGKRHAAHIKARSVQILRGGISDELFTFYRCYRATLRARLAVAHLLEPAPRTPAKWPRQGMEYLDLARNDARRLQRHLG
jgi:aminoglycoside phosphotransferase family enzyme